jgi:hypothetical protein
VIEFVEEIEQRIANLALGREGCRMVFAAQHRERAAPPVPQGERSILPGRIATALRLVRYLIFEIRGSIN